MPTGNHSITFKLTAGFDDGDEITLLVARRQETDEGATVAIGGARFLREMPMIVELELGSIIDGMKEALARATSGKTEPLYRVKTIDDLIDGALHGGEPDEEDLAD